jgi:hypothetical protein
VVFALYKEEALHVESLLRQRYITSSVIPMDFMENS